MICVSVVEEYWYSRGVVTCIFEQTVGGRELNAESIVCS